MLALRAPRERGAGAEGTESALFGKSPTPDFGLSDGLPCESGTGMAPDPPAAAARAESCPRLGGPFGWDDGPGSAKASSASACCEWTD